MKKPCAVPGCLNQARRRGLCFTCKRDAKVEKAAKASKSTLLREEVVEKGNERNITVQTETPIRTLEQLVEACQIDLQEWEVVEWTANKWDNGVKPLFQVKARLRRKLVIIDARAEIAELKELAKRDIIKPFVQQKRDPTFCCTKERGTGRLLELDIFDLHLGKLAWKKETGYPHYDLKIARQLFEEALDTLVQRVAGHEFDHVLFPVGNDFFHTDSLLNETTAGTRQDSDGRFHKSARIGRELVTHAIERLRMLAPVTVLIVPGNHDQLSAWHLGDSLECYYHRDEDVIVENEPTLRKYFEFGKNMLMFTHGNKGKHPDYPLVMATEQPEMWGRTKFREAHLGHLHQLSVRELHGVRVRVLSSLTSADAWHSENQFVGNQRQAEAFVWDREEGLVTQATYTAP